MAKSKIRTGIIGCGKVTHMHAQALSNLPESEFVAIFSRELQKARQFGGLYKVKAYNDIEKMVIESSLDAVIICTPHPNHVDGALLAIKAGVHVLIEKPLASSLEDCDLMISAAKENKVLLGMVCQRRFYPPALRIKKAIDEGKIGKPILGTIQMLGWRDANYYKSDPWRGKWVEEGGGVLVNQAPHQLDLLQWYMGEIDEIYGCWANLNHPYIEVDDTAVAIIRFKSGALGNIVLSNSQNPALFGKVHVHGDNGASVGIQTDGGAMFIAGMTGITEPPVNDLWTIKGEENMLEIWNKEDTSFFNSINAVDYFHERQVEDFLKAIIENRKPLITGEDGRVTVEIFTAIYRTQRDGKPAKFPLFSEIGRKDFDGRIRK
jgi:UDP-N-acetyl-2-amino-2-deoxyglucuronate dehydrogenase